MVCTERLVLAMTGRTIGEKGDGKGDERKKLEEKEVPL